MRSVWVSVMVVCGVGSMALADGVDDLLVFRPSNGVFYSGWTEASGLSFTNGSNVQFGSPDYDPFVGDVNADGLDDVLIYNRTNGRWLSGITAANGTLTGTGSEVFGPYLAGDIANVGDLNGDGRVDLVLFRPSNGQFISGITAANGTLTGSGMTIQFGSPDYTPLVGDINADGRADLLIYNKTNGRWVSGITGPGGTLTSSGSDLFGPFLAGDIPQVGDVNGDGRIDMLIYRPSDGVWYSGITDGNGALTWTGTQVQFGTADYLPRVGDVNRDGRADLLIYNTTSGRWISGITAPDGTLTSLGTEVFGPYLVGDVPLVGDVGGNVPLPGCYDSDNDSDVDMDDFGAFQLCYAGATAAVPSGCTCYDKGGGSPNGHIDTADFTAFAACVSGPAIPAANGCE